MRQSRQSMITVNCTVAGLLGSTIVLLGGCTQQKTATAADSVKPTTFATATTRPVLNAKPNSRDTFPLAPRPAGGAFTLTETFEAQALPVLAIRSAQNSTLVGPKDAPETLPPRVSASMAVVRRSQANASPMQVPVEYGLVIRQHPGQTLTLGEAHVRRLATTLTQYTTDAERRSSGADSGTPRPVGIEFAVPGAAFSVSPDEPDVLIVRSGETATVARYTRKGFEAALVTATNQIDHLMRRDRP